MATTAARPLTLEEFSRLPRDGERHEMSAGELITMPPVKLLHTLIAQNIQELLQFHLKQIGRARALMEAGYILESIPLTIRQPDVSVLSYDRIRGTGVESYCEGAPELAIEVVSPSDSAEDLELKAQQYLQAGAIEVWIVYPRTKTVHIFDIGGVKVLKHSDVLTCSALLPGLSVKVSEFFLQ